MIQSPLQAAARGLVVNTPKRTRDELLSSTHRAEIIDLTSDDDEAPAPKRQKSQPPLTNNIPLQHASIDDPIRPPSTPEHAKHQPSPQVASGSGHVKQSPFKRKPSWLVTNDEDDDDLSRFFKPFVGHIPARASTGLAQSSHPVPVSSNDGNKSSTQFKLPLINSLKFETGSHNTGPSSSSATKDSQPSAPNNHVLSSPSISNSRPTTTMGKPLSNGQVKVNKLSVEVPIRPSVPLASSHPHKPMQPQPVLGTPKTVLFQRQSGASETPRSGLIINVPLTQNKQKRQDVQNALKLSTESARRDPETIEKTLGLFGFSSVYAPVDESDKMRQAAQPKKRKVDRSKVILDLPPRQNSSAVSDTRSFVHPRDQVKAILTNRFDEVFDPPLTFTNTINDHRLNGKFQFIKDYIIRKGVRTAGGISRIGCRATCASGQCELSCSCLTVNQDSGSPPKTITSYRRRADGLVVLTEDQINEHASRAEIIECDDHCPCSQDCINRVVQKGRTVPLDIFQTTRCGFGVRSTQDLVRGQFIEIYLGEVLTEAELNRREDAAEEEQSSYVYSLDWFSSQNAYQIDGQNFGSAMRFVNHSCDPNARTVPVMNSTSTKNLYYIAFFAVKSIPAMTEITIDYIPQNALKNDDDDEDSNDDEKAKSELMYASMGDLNLEQDQDLVECLCGAPNCRRRLWGGPKRKTRKKLLG